MNAVIRITQVLLLSCCVCLAAPIGICLHSPSPETPAEKIECFEFERMEKLSGSTRFFLTNGQSAVVTDYRRRGILYYPRGTVSNPDVQLNSLRKTASESPNTKAFLAPWIARLETHQAALTQQATQDNQLPTLDLPDGTHLTGCKATKIEGDLVSIQHTDGIKRVKITDIPESSRNALNLSSLVAVTPPAVSDTPEAPHAGKTNDSEPPQIPPAQDPSDNTSKREPSTKGTGGVFGGGFVLPGEDATAPEPAPSPPSLNIEPPAHPNPSSQPTPTKRDSSDENEKAISHPSPPETPQASAPQASAPQAAPDTNHSRTIPNHPESTQPSEESAVSDSKKEKSQPASFLSTIRSNGPVILVPLCFILIAVFCFLFIRLKRKYLRPLLLKAKALRFRRISTATDSECESAISHKLHGIPTLLVLIFIGAVGLATLSKHSNSTGNQSNTNQPSEEAPKSPEQVQYNNALITAYKLGYKMGCRNPGTNPDALREVTDTILSGAYGDPNYNQIRLAYNLGLEDGCYGRKMGESLK